MDLAIVNQVSHHDKAPTLLIINEYGIYDIYVAQNSRMETLNLESAKPREVDTLASQQKKSRISLKSGE